MDVQKSFESREKALGKQIEELVVEKKKLQHLLKTSEERVKTLTRENGDLESKYH